MKAEGIMINSIINDIVNRQSEGNDIKQKRTNTIKYCACEHQLRYTHHHEPTDHGERGWIDAIVHHKPQYEITSSSTAYS